MYVAKYVVNPMFLKPYRLTSPMTFNEGHPGSPTASSEFYLHELSYKYLLSIHYVPDAMFLVTSPAKQSSCLQTALSPVQKSRQ